MNKNLKDFGAPKKELAGKSVRQGFVGLSGLVVVLSPQLFFSSYALVGEQYEGKNTSFMYVAFIAINLSILFLVFISSYLKKCRLDLPELLFYIYFFILLSIHLMWASLDDGTEWFPRNLILFLSMGVPGFMAARVITVYGVWRETIKVAEVLLLFIAFSVIVAIIVPLFSSERVRGLGGATYQSASYYAAMCYGMIGLYTFRLPVEYRFIFLRCRLMMLINTLVMAAMIIAVLINSGRGGFVLLVAYTVMIIFWVANGNDRGLSWAVRSIAISLGIAILTPIVIRWNFNNPTLAAGWQRATSFIDSPENGFLDLEGGGSGRSLIYREAVNGILESPLIGYGPFGHWEKVIHPHNLFFDMALQFGVPAAFFIITGVSFALFSILFKARGLRVEQIWLFVLFAYPSISLMVSFSYLHLALFWYCLCGLFATKK